MIGLEGLDDEQRLAVAVAADAAMLRLLATLIEATRKPLARGFQDSYRGDRRLAYGDVRHEAMRRVNEAGPE